MRNQSLLPAALLLMAAPPLLAADDDVGALLTLIALVAVQRLGLLVDLDLVGREAALDQGGDEGLGVAEFGFAFDEVGHRNLLVRW